MSGGKHGATWWSGRFLRSLERLGMTTRLRRGHAYFEAGRVLTLEITPGTVSSTVQGSKVHQCLIHFEPFSQLEWNESLERLAFADLSAAALLTTGRLPPQIESFFQPSGRRLLPQGGNDLEFHCTCSDQTVPCKHLGATAYLLAERLDRDPWILFMLRGRSAQEVEDTLLSLWNRETGPEEVSSLSQDEMKVDSAKSEYQNVDLFWGNQLKEPILFPPSRESVISLTIERMATPEPKVDEAAWHKALHAVFQIMAERAEKT